MLQTDPGGPERPLQVSDLTRWDLFLSVAGRPEGIALTRLAHDLRVPKEGTLFRPLEELVDERLIVREDDRYSLAPQRRAQGLNRTLSFAIAYDLDYNAYFQDEMLAFLRKVYGFDYFIENDVPPELLRPEVLARLIHNELLLVYKFRPFTGKLIENPFLDGLSEFLGLHRHHALFRKRIGLENVIKDKLSASQTGGKAQAVYARKLLGREALARERWGLGEVPRILKARVVSENTELFDQAAERCFTGAFERMRERVQQKRRLDLDLVREYHGLAMASSGTSGDFRTHAVQVRNNPYFKTAPPKQIEALLQDLVKTVATRKLPTFLDILRLGAYLYNQFVFIHPFEDGNSRTARILLGHLLRENRMPFEEIPRSYEVRFLQATKGYRRRDDDALLVLLNEVYLNHLNREELETARALPSQV